MKYNVFLNLVPQQGYNLYYISICILQSPDCSRVNAAVNSAEGKVPVYNRKQRQKRQLGLEEGACSKGWWTRLLPSSPCQVPFYPDLFRVHISVGHCSILPSCFHSRIYSIATLGNRKPLFDLRHIPRHGVTLKAKGTDEDHYKEEDWWGLNLLQLFCRLFV